MTDISALEGYAGQLSEAAAQAKAASAKQAQYVGGSAHLDVETEGGMVPTLAKQARLADEKIDAALIDVAARMAGAMVFDSTAAGLAAVPANGYFSVPSASSAEYLVLYKKEGGVAVEKSRYPSASAVQAQKAATDELAQSLAQTQEILTNRFARYLAFAVLDAFGNQTWLGVNSIDGGPSEWAEHMLRRMFGIFLQGRTGLLFGFADANGVLTDLCVDDVTGQFMPFVVERLAPRLLPYMLPHLPQPSGDSAWLLNDQYVDDAGDVRRVFAKPLSWSGWGSSTIDEWVELGNIAAEFGATYYNGGNGATELHHNLAQMGARPALLFPQGGEIPASGAVVVACSNVSPVAPFKATAGTLSGVSGVLTCNSTEWTFTRSTSGSAVAVSVEAPFIPTNGLLHRGDLWLMNQGKNNINNNWPMDLTIELHKMAYNWNSAYNKRVIVMTHFGHTGNQSPSHTAKCKQLNNFINATYGAHVFDLAGYLCSAEIWADTGITPTAADLQNQAAGCLPGSLSRDNAAHMNAKARTAAANKLKAQLITMGWFKA